VALPKFACRMPLLQQSIDISCPMGPQQQTCSSQQGHAGTDRWMDTIPFHTMQAVPITKEKNLQQ